MPRYRCAGEQQQCDYDLCINCMGPVLTRARLIIERNFVFFLSLSSLDLLLPSIQDTCISLVKDLKVLPKLGVACREHFGVKSIKLLVFIIK